MTVRVFPVRHHGPGSARALAASLRSWEPDAVLIEGPPEANSVLEFAGSAEMRPPVALLAYLPGKPSLSAFYPMSSWSPEWVALQHAVSRGVRATMIDLPAGVMLSDRGKKGPQDGGPPDGPSGPRDGEAGVADGETETAGPPAALSDDEVLAGDPIGRLAEAAGYDDPERWWEDVVEHRAEGEPWDAIIEAMAELRAHPQGRLDSAHLELEAQREASMRQHIRAAEKHHDRVAVVCGAWHAPVLVERGPAKPDQALLAGLPRERATVTWVPWTYTRLAFASGYGAGVTSPGWYEHLYASPDRPIERWMVRVAALLRAERLDAPPASVVEAVRLAEALATMRSRPLAGLAECTDAARSVLGGGYDTVLNLIGRRLVVGDAIGEVPAEAPTVPLAADLAAQQRRLRLRPESGARALELDLRRDTDLGRSQLLHRLNLLGVPWGKLTAQQRGTGTFREEWALHWEPELSVRAIEASLYGTTVEAAATAKAVEAAGNATDVAEVTRLVEQCLLAELPGALAAVMAALDERSALSTDVGELMDAVAPLARVLRYGTVRRTEVAALERVVHGLVARLCVSLGPAMVSLDGTAAEAMTRRISAVTAALAPLPDQSLRREWLATLAVLSATPALHGLPAGRATRIVFDAELISAGDVARRLSAALSRGEDPAHGASWIEGLLAGSGLLLVHDRALLALVDEWVAWVSAEIFNDVLPLLRRTFALFEQGERRLIGEAARRLGAQGGGVSSSPEDRSQDVEHLDQERAEAVLPLVSLLLGVEAHVSDERLRRWRLVLGGDVTPGYEALEGDDAARDAALSALYNQRPVGRTRDNRGQSMVRDAGLGGSAPKVARWLGDIRTYFPTTVVRVMQSDAMERLGLRQLLLEPELLEVVEPDVSLVATLVALNRVIPDHSRETARTVVRAVTDELERRLAQKTRSAVAGALNRAARSRRPKPADIDWGRTVLANLRHYQPDYRAIIPERLVGYSRRQQSLQRDVILAIDQSGSMAASVVYASVFSAVLASMRSLRTRLVVFDTNVVDLTAELDDPVDILFATQLGGGTDINQAVTYCATLVERPYDTIMVLLSDLIEGGLRGEFVQRMAALVDGGVVVVALLALNDDGSPAYDHAMAASLAEVGVTAFACTPDQFPDLMAAAIERRDLSRWAAENRITTAAPLT